ncbi:MAG: flagellar FliJ family protein [Opitutaceae bacterium]|nr:flagellar FliJ family protein [Opitutaceae bacterium]
MAVVRAHREGQAREAFAAAARAQAAAAARLAAARARAAGLADLVAAGRRAAFRAPDAAAFLRAYRQECAAEGEAAREAAAAAAELAARRTAYLAAHRDLKVVRQLEDRARADHRRAVARAEQTELDELAGFRALRRTPAFSP